MQYWVSVKDNKLVEQVICEDGEEPRWSKDSEEADKIQVERHGDLPAETFDAETLTWSPSVDYAFECLRNERNRRLFECEYPPLYERPEEDQPAWRVYRQALRDLPQNTDPFNPEWPEKPK